LREGLVWRIGNGQKIKVWEDNWIPRSGLMRPIGTKPDSMQVSLVSELLHVDGQGWNEAKVKELFFDGDVEDILKIPVGRAGTADYLAWNYTKNGVFTVKSAYHLKMQLNRARAETRCPRQNIKDVWLCGMRWFQEKLKSMPGG
jgi:hypothetical protein